MAVSNRVKGTIASASTPQQVWELVASLLQDGNNYSDATYLENARAYAAAAVKMHAEGVDHV